MTRYRSFRIVGAKVIFLLAAVLTWAAPATAEKYALLVGCTRYPELPESRQLVGPSRDVVLFRRFLAERFGFKNQQHITTLAEEASDGLPTRENIHQQFLRLANLARPDDVIVILLSGHGSQQPLPPDNDPVKHFKPDGMDEVFCPRDVKRLTATASGGIRNGIVDVEIGQWLQGILDKGAFVWIICDACHSATMIRGNGEERTRTIPPGFFFSEKQIAEARKRATLTPATDAARLRIAGAGTARKQRLVALYACQTSEVEPEDRYPRGDAKAECYGLLTYTLVRVLTECRTPITYRELTQAIHSQYVAMGRAQPTPLVEGPEQVRFVMNDSTAGRRLTIQLKADSQGQLLINAGAIHGLTKGTILAVYPPPGDKEPEKLLGHVRIVGLGIPTSTVEPCEYGKTAARSELPDNARCEVVELDCGLDRLRFAVDDRDPAGRPVATALRKQWCEELRGLVAKDPRSLVRLVESPRQADWLVRLDGERVILVPGSGWPVQPGRSGPPTFQPDARTTQPAEGVRLALEAIARASNLVRLASLHRESVQAQFGKDLDVDVQIELLEKETDTKGKPLVWQAAGRTVPVGTYNFLRIENRESVAVDVTLLYVDSQYGITAIFPEAGEQNRIPPKTSRSIGPGKVTSDTMGLEHIILLAAPSHAEQLPADFSFLGQPALQEVVVRGLPPKDARSRGGSQSALEQLLATALEGGGTSRGVWTKQSGHYSIRGISFQVTPKAK